ncbi:hypothetical protein TNCT_311691, partial [Trichonephila clavata]
MKFFKEKKPNPERKEVIFSKNITGWKIKILSHSDNLEDYNSIKGEKFRSQKTIFKQ